jgi:hypothetical protein
MPVQFTHTGDTHAIRKAERRIPWNNYHAIAKTM